ncbi:MAG: hypothetical protein A4E72_01710 [Syntrophus sp. PtaU1.Bin208]|nr:MAG: hypothetical protein A4E72_01710 [Syntrophus sp. PtaU1.Bin208]
MAARCLIEMDQPLLEEKLADFLPGHLLRGSPFTHEELAAEGIRLAVLLRHGDAQNPRHTGDRHRNRRLGGTGDGLHLGLEPVVIVNADNVATVRHPDQDNPARGIGKSTEFPPEIGGPRFLEFGGKAFT